MHSLEAFLGSIGSLYFASNGYASRLSLLPCGFAYTTTYTLTPGQPSPGGATFLRHPIALLLRNEVPRSTTPDPSEDFTNVLWVVSIKRLAMGAHARVREHQTVVHRLRLSASP